MGFCEVLTIVFVVLKVLEVITWSWWLVFLPEIIAAALYVIAFILPLIGIVPTRKRIRKHFNHFFDI